MRALERPSAKYVSGFALCVTAPRALLLLLLAKCVLVLAAPPLLCRADLCPGVLATNERAVLRDTLRPLGAAAVSPEVPIPVGATSTCSPPAAKSVCGYGFLAYPSSVIVSVAEPDGRDAAGH